VLHIPTNQGSLLTLCHFKYCLQAAGARQEPAGALPGGGRCLVWLGRAPAVGLQTPTSTLPSQPASSLERWRPGSTHPAASSRGHCYTEEEEEEEEEERVQKASQSWGFISRHENICL